MFSNSFLSAESIYCLSKHPDHDVFCVYFHMLPFLPKQKILQAKGWQRMLNKAIYSVGNSCVKIYKILLWNVASVLWFKRLQDKCVPLIVLITCLYFNWTRRRLWFNLPWTFSSCNITLGCILLNMKQKNKCCVLSAICNPTHSGLKT